MNRFLSVRALRETLRHNRAFYRSRAGKAAGLAVIGITAATVVGAFLLWPDDRATPESSGSFKPSRAAVVTAVASETCPGTSVDACRRVTFRMLDGPDRGREAFFRVPPSSLNPYFSPGERVRVAKNEIAPSVAAASNDVAPYILRDYDRIPSLIWLAAIFVGVLLVFARWHGVRSLIGLGVSLVVVVEFIIPGIVAGKPPLAVAVVGSMGVMLATIFIAHGFGPKSLAAILGTAPSLGAILGLAALFTATSHIAGIPPNDETRQLIANAPVSISGLVVAGMVIGAMGVLDDLTVSQASIVMALRAADPGQSTLTVIRRALAVGRDHAGAAVNTLVLAYLGGALPVFVVLAVVGFPILEAANRLSVAEEIVSMLVGSIGLIASIPLTTVVAATLAKRLPIEAIEDGAGHAH